MNAEMEIPENKASVLPEESVVRFEGRQYVFEIQGKNKFKMIAVQTGSIENGWVEILNGILNYSSFFGIGSFGQVWCIFFAFLLFLCLARIYFYNVPLTGIT